LRDRSYPCKIATNGLKERQFNQTSH